ncbi:MAG: hypothetical protein J0H54_11860, partial [Rhizobiales bacterium]|nr:hypothetical protein [Hyphomicrobiales bacterium]
KGTDPVALIRLEQQVAAIRNALEEKLPRHPDAGTAILGRLEQRLDALAGRFDALADLPNLLAPASGEAVTSLKAEISSLRDEVATRHPARLDEIEQQMRSLIGRIDDAALRDDGPALAALEAQVGQLADKLATIEPGSDALAKVETNLDRLQGLLADARRDTIETARATARTTVEEFAGALAGGRDDAMVAALREDLKRLQDAALRADQENQDTLEAVHDTLAKVVDRIAQLEAEDAGIAVGFGSIKERARNAIAPRLAAEDAPEDHRPLVPGSGKPDLTGAAPREEAAMPRPGDRKADFIAAARRAAQAAQAETARARAEDRKAGQDEGKPGPLARIGQALRSRRRPLVLAIAAVVLAIGAAKFGPALSYRVADALTPAKAERPVASAKEAPVDRSVTGSIAAKPVRAAEANPPAARLAAPAAASQPAAPLVAPKASSDAFAFSPDPFTDFLAAPAPKSGAIAVAAGPSGLDYARIEAAAAGGNAIAAFEMGRHLAEPEVGRADIKQAAIWYERAAKAG